MKIQTEKFTGAMAEDAIALVQSNADETGPFSDLPLKLDIDKYVVLQNAGVLKVFTAREDGKLIGYISTIITPSMHHADYLQGYVDSMYIKPGHRNGFVFYKLITIMEDYMFSRGVEILMFHIQAEHDHSSLLERRGYKFLEKIMCKRAA